VLLAGLPALVLAACGAPPTVTPDFRSDDVRPVAWREPSLDILDYDIDLTLDARAGHVEGSVAIRVRAPSDRPVTQLVLDAVDLELRDASDEQGRLLVVEPGDQTLCVRFAEPLLPGQEGSLRLAWSAFPRRGILFVGPFPGSTRSGTHVWSQGQAEDTRHWMPVWDLPNDPATHTLTLTVDDAFTTMAGGTLVSSERNERTGTRTETWRTDSPHASYLISLVAGDFARGELDGASVPMPVLADADELPLALENARHVPQMMAVLEDFTGRPYPYPKYAQTFVHDFGAGGMENISATTLYDEGLHDPADEPDLDITNLLAHELAHQWFGDLLCARDWSEIWLNEGFANYGEALVLGALHGPLEQALVLRAWQREAVAAAALSPHALVHTGFSHPDEVFDDLAYQGGAARLYLLRDQLGEAGFLAGVRTYVARHAGGVVDSADLQAAFEAASGRDLDAFFEDWVRSPGYPEIRGRMAPDGLHLLLEQLPGGPERRPLYRLEFSLAWSRGGQLRHARLPFDAPTVGCVLDGEGPLDWVQLDAAGVLPGIARMEQDEAAWRAMLAADDPLARLLAAEWFLADGWVRDLQRQPAAPPEPASRAALEQLARRATERPETRCAALEALALDGDDALHLLVLDLCEDEVAAVRAAAVSALGADARSEGRAVLRRAVDDPAAEVMLAALNALVARRDPTAWTTLQRLYSELPERRVRLRRDLVELAPAAGGAQALPFLVGVLRTSPERWERAAAATALGSWRGEHEESAFWQLCEALHDASAHVRAAVAGALAATGNPRALLQLQARRAIESQHDALTALDAALASCEAARAAAASGPGPPDGSTP